MKKIIGVILACLLLTVFSLSVSAGEFTTVPADCCKTVTTPVIDGIFDFNEGWGDPIADIPFEEAEGYMFLCDSEHPELLKDPFMVPLNVKTYFRWDDEKFYFCAVVNQATPSNTFHDPASIWKGNSWIFNICEDPGIDDDKTRFVIGLTSDTNEVIVFPETAEGSCPGVADAKEFMVTRNEATQLTVYEFAVKWTDVLDNGEKIALGSEFSFRALMCPTNSPDFEDPIDYVPSGMNAEGGKNWWRVKLVEAPVIPETPAEAPAAEAAEPETQAPVSSAPKTADNIGAAAILLLCGAAVVIAAGRRR